MVAIASELTDHIVSRVAEAHQQNFLASKAGAAVIIYAVKDFALIVFQTGETEGKTQAICQRRPW